MLTTTQQGVLDGAGIELVFESCGVAEDCVTVRTSVNGSVGRIAVIGW